MKSICFNKEIEFVLSLVPSPLSDFHGKCIFGSRIELNIFVQVGAWMEFSAKNLKDGWRKTRFTSKLE